MIDDPRIKRVLKRYRKNEDCSDASMDVSALGIDELLAACRLTSAASLAGPRQLDGFATDYLSQRMGISFDTDEFDFYLHSYVRSEFVPTYYSDPSVTSQPAPENGPPAKIPLPEGKYWQAVRPKDGKEHFEAWEFSESNEEH